jgi:NTP pyrophosphatase (non-canonical NTP hydrolase)
LCGEAGEIANKTKKVLRDDNGVISEKKKNELGAEIGDCLWYIAALCNDLGLNLGDIAQENLNKLNDRKNRGVIKGSGDTR